MFILDTYTIIFSSVLLFAALLSSIISPLFRRPRLSESYNKEDIAEETTEEYITSAQPIEKDVEKVIEPSISIILTPNDDALALSKNLNKYLNQDYKDF